MLKRPLHTRFHDAVLAGTKTTTIRSKPWPVGVPIMLYHWAGAAYRSKQADCAAVIVEETREIRITHRADGGMLYAYGQPGERPLHATEGFATRDELDAWFRPLVKPGTTLTKHLMRFRLNERILRMANGSSIAIPPPGISTQAAIEASKRIGSVTFI